MRLRRPRAISVSLGDQVFAQSRQGDRKLDGRAGLRAARKRQFLVHHGQHAAAGRLDGEHGAVHVAQCVDGGLADDRIFAGGDVAVAGVDSVGTGRESLVITVAAAYTPAVTERGPGDRAMRTGQGFHALAGAWSFADRACSGLSRCQRARRNGGGNGTARQDDQE